MILCGAGKPAQADRRIYLSAASTALPAKVIDGWSAERAEQGASPGKELSAPPVDVQRSAAQQSMKTETFVAIIPENGDGQLAAARDPPGHNPRKRGDCSGEKCKKSPAKGIDLSAGDMV